MNKLFCLIGESGSGKNVIMEEVLKQSEQQNINLKRCMSCTTRPIRSDIETDGVDYNFITMSQFDSDYKNNKIKEYNAYRIDSVNETWVYYTREEDIKLDESNMLKIVNPSGYSQLKSQYSDIVSIRITCPKEIRIQRYLQRGSTLDNVNDRIARDDLDFKYLVTDYEFVNDGSKSIEEVAKDVLNIIKEEIEQYE